jgi:alanine racemase
MIFSSLRALRAPKPLAWVEIDLGAIRHNFHQIQALAHDQLEPQARHQVDILSVVKADSYGHGMVEVAKAIAKEGGRFFAVSNAQEAVALRQSGCKHRIILFETTMPDLVPHLVKYNLTPAVCTREFARDLDTCARRARKIVPVHVKIDTGMGRLGVWHKDAAHFIRDIAGLKHLKIEGLFTHFPVADTDEAFTREQMHDFSNVVADLIEDGIAFTYLHAANSMGLGGYRNRFFNLVRPGVSLYGLYPAEEMRPIISLKPAMTVKATVLFVKTIHRGSGVSYGHTFKALQDIPAAVISIGYSDGYLRAFSNKAYVLINGVPCPVLGRVTMDQTIVDISLALCADKVKIGDEAVVLGRQGKSVISADELAQWAGTINYEIVCNLGNRLSRRYI